MPRYKPTSSGVCGGLTFSKSSVNSGAGAAGTPGVASASGVAASEHAATAASRRVHRAIGLALTPRRLWRFREVHGALARPQPDRLVLGEVANVDEAGPHAGERPVAAILDEPPGAADRRRRMRGARAEVALALAP